MSLRRITGCVVMALLLASVALPATCGACMDFAAKPACGEKHDAGASSSAQLSVAMAAYCTDCGDQPGITVKQTAQHAPVSGFMMLDCARRICVQAAEQTAAIYRDRVDAQQLVGDRATFGVAAVVRAAMRSDHWTVFGLNKTISVNSAHRPLLVSLKI